MEDVERSGFSLLLVDVFYVLLKEKRKIASIHKKIGNARKDYLQKHSTTISKNHAVEDLQVKNMSKSARGNFEKPGKNVRAKSDLNRSMLDQGWGSFIRMLEYKLEWNGGMLSRFHPATQTKTTRAHFAATKLKRIGRIKDRSFCV